MTDNLHVCIFLLLLKSSRMVRRQRVRMNYQERKAVSPVIATVILVAVAITVSIGVSYWMGGIAGQYTDFEKIEIQAASSTYVNGNWEVVMTLKNSGTATATITQVYVNEDAVDLGTVTVPNTQPVAQVATLTVDIESDLAWQLTAGDSADITVWIGGAYGTLSSGTTVNVKAHSAGGMDYIKLVQLT